MRHHSTRFFAALFAGSILLLLPLTIAAADDPLTPVQLKSDPPDTKKAEDPGIAQTPQVKDAEKVREMNLVDAMRDGLVSVKAEGIGDGRMTLSVTNKSKKQLRVVLPPGIIAQGATGQFGGMGGMGGGMGGMGGGMGGMGGGMGGMGGGGGIGGGGGMMGGMGGMGRQAGTMPARWA